MLIPRPQEIVGLDNDIKSKFGQYNTLRNSLSAAQKRQTGNLSTKSLVSVVPPKLMVTDSEYLETHLLAVPKSSVKEYLKSYETLCPMVVPRSSMEVARDDEFSLYAVTVFKKHGSEFVHKCRERRWNVRDYRQKEGGADEERKEVEKLEKDERKVWGEALRLGRTAYSEAVMSWTHVMALRVFVESVLRYGLPANYVCGMVSVSIMLHGTAAVEVLADCDYRRHPSSPSAQNTRSTTATITLAATQSREIRKESRRVMTRLCSRRCSKLVTMAMLSILRMCTMSSSSINISA